MHGGSYATARASLESRSVHVDQTRRNAAICKWLQLQPIVELSHAGGLCIFSRTASAHRVWKSGLQNAATQVQSNQAAVYVPLT